MTKFPIEGGCDCGHVRYQILLEPLFVHCCHCRWCQRETGSAFVLNAMIESELVSLISGEVEMINTPSASGKGQQIARCPHCQIALWSHYAGAGESIKFVRVGTLDNPDLLPPDIHIFTASKQPWLKLGDQVPVMEEYYHRKDYWPEASLERWQSVKAKKK